MNILKLGAIAIAAYLAQKHITINIEDLVQYKDIVMSALIAAALLPRVSEWFE